MKITIDKAQKLYDTLKKDLNKIHPINSVSVSYDPSYSEDQIFDKIQTDVENIKRDVEAYWVIFKDKFNLKSAIFKANVLNGIDDKVNSLQLLRDKLSHLENYQTNGDVYSNITKEFISRKLSLIKDTVNKNTERASLSILVPDEVYTLRKEVKKEISILEDEIKRLNFITEIEIELSDVTKEHLNM